MAMTLWWTDDDEQILAALALREGISREEAALRAIREAGARHGHQQSVREASAQARIRYANLLDRFAQ